jgi:hypothetical protein
MVPWVVDLAAAIPRISMEHAEFRGGREGNGDDGLRYHLKEGWRGWAP